MLFNISSTCQANSLSYYNTLRSKIKKKKRLLSSKNMNRELSLFFSQELLLPMRPKEDRTTALLPSSVWKDMVLKDWRIYLVERKGSINTLHRLSVHSQQAFSEHLLLTRSPEWGPEMGGEVDVTS